MAVTPSPGAAMGSLPPGRHRAVPGLPWVPGLGGFLVFGEVFHPPLKGAPLDGETRSLRAGAL